MFRVWIRAIVAILLCWIAPGCVTSAAWEALSDRPLVSVSGISVSQEASSTDADVLSVVVTVAYVDGVRSSERWRLKTCQDPELMAGVGARLEGGNRSLSSPANRPDKTKW